MRFKIFKTRKFFICLRWVVYDERQMCFVICKLRPAIEQAQSRVAIMKILCKFPNLITVGGASVPSIRNLSPQFEAIFTTNSNERSRTLSSHFGI